MSQKPPVHHPITGVCIVSDPQKCPPNYELILRSFDRKDDCDLWGESLIRRTSRFLCFTREVPIAGRNNVLTGIAIYNEKDAPSPGFTALDRTFDSAEKALKKKQIAITMSSRDVTTDAISDIVFQSKSKRAPEGYTLVGEINSFQLCYKLSKVPAETQTFSHASPVGVSQPNRQAPLPPIPFSGLPPKVGAKQPAKPPVAAPRVLNKSDSRLAINHDISYTVRSAMTATHRDLAIADVPFCLNLKHRDLSNLKAKTTPEILFRSIVDIKNEYDYSFILERSAVGRRA